MATRYPDRVKLLHAITSIVTDAVEDGRPLRTGTTAAQLALHFPQCGLTLGGIENELIRQIGFAQGIAEIGERQGGASKPDHRSPPPSSTSKGH